jgi:hypothetical protein
VTRNKNAFITQTLSLAINYMEEFSEQFHFTVMNIKLSMKDPCTLKMHLAANDST